MAGLTVPEYVCDMFKRSRCRAGWKRCTTCGAKNTEEFFWKLVRAHWTYPEWYRLKERARMLDKGRRGELE